MKGIYRYLKTGNGFLETDLSLYSWYGLYIQYGKESRKIVAPRIGNINPDSKAGNARLGMGRGSNAGRSQPVSARALRAALKSNALKPTSMTNKNPLIGTYKMPTIKTPAEMMRGYTGSEGGLIFGLGVTGGVLGAIVADQRRDDTKKRDKAIKKASVKTRKGQSAGR